MVLLSFKRDAMQIMVAICLFTTLYRDALAVSMQLNAKYWVNVNIIALLSPMFLKHVKINQMFVSKAEAILWKYYIRSQIA